MSPSTLGTIAVLAVSVAIIAAAHGPQDVGLLAWFCSLSGEVQAVLVGWVGFTASYVIRPILDENRERLRKRQRVLNLLQIVRSEVEQTRENLLKRFSPSTLDNIRANLTNPATAPVYVPFMSFVAVNPIIDRVSDEIHMLERDFGNALMDYNENDALLAVMLSDLRSETYLAMSPERRLVFVENIFHHVAEHLTLIDTIIARFKSSRDLLRD